jgi:mono/diheme cytochrome c family protein
MRQCKPMTKRGRAIFLPVVSFAVAVPLLAQAPAVSRGALLYETHCVACHDTQVHWRDRKLVADWAGLSAQVRRWQANAGLDWTDDEIDDVVRYLNAAIYRFPDQAPRQTG